MLRRILLFLSGQGWLRRAMEKSRLARPMVRRFVAGEELAEAIAVCRKLNGESILATLDHLGENVSSASEARASLDQALLALRALDGLDTGATLSIKLTQFGLDLEEDGCRRNVEDLAAAARSTGERVEIDMEGSPYTGRTLEIASDLHARFGNVRVCVQAYLRRSEADIERLNASGIPIRLCKGAYLEPPEIAYETKSEVDASYRRLALLLLSKGTCPALATHDEAIIREALAHIAELRLSPDRYEFQMLYGIRRDLQRKLAAGGHRIRLYVPYGQAWYPYFMRRLAERPANVVFMLRNLVKP